MKVRITTELYKVTFADGKSYLSSEHPDTCVKYESRDEMREISLYKEATFVAIPTGDNVATLGQRIRARFPHSTIELVENVTFLSTFTI